MRPPLSFPSRAREAGTIELTMWRVEYDPRERLLTLRLTREVRLFDMRTVARAHAQALESSGGQRFRVLADLRGLHPLDPDSAAVFQDMKRVAAQVAGYAGRVILTDSATIAMQQRNSTLEDGGDSSELITLDLEEARRFIREH